LIRRVQDLRSGRGGAVVIEGEPGIGKSHLVRALVADAVTNQIRCVVGSADAAERDTPYYAWRSVYADLCGLAPHAGHVNAVTDVLARSTADPTMRSLAPLLNAVIATNVPDNELTSQMVGQVRAENTVKLLVNIVSSIAEERPLLIVVEDCHWLDSASWALVRAICLEVRRVLLVLTRRPPVDAVTPDVEFVLSSDTTDVLRLEGFGPEQTGVLLCELMGVQRVAESVVAFVNERADGNPFFVRALAQALRDRDIIVVADGECQFVSTDVDPGDLKVPETIEGLVTSQIDQLDGGAQLSLKVAAVIGRSFSLEILESVHPAHKSSAELLHHLDVLQRAALLDRVDDGIGSHYAFCHAIVQQVAYDLLPFAYRRPLHVAVAGTYEHLFAKNLQPMLPVLAHHYRLGGKTGKALEFLERAGDQALRLFNNQEAIRFFGHAFALVDDANSAQARERLAYWHLQLGEALINESRYSAGVKHLYDGLRLAGKPAPESTTRRVLWVISGSVKQLVARLAGHRQPRRTSTTIIPIHRAYVRLAEAAYYYQKGPLPLITSILGAVDSAQKSGATADLAEAYASLGGFMAIARARRIAEWYLRRALALAEECGAHEARTLVWIVAGLYDIATGAWGDAEDLFQRLVTASERLGDGRRLMDGMSNLYWIHEFRGEFGKIEELATNLLRMAERKRDSRYQVEALLRLAWVDLTFGRANHAISLLDDAHRRLQERGGVVDAALQLEIRGLYAVAHLRGSAPEVAIQAADDTLAMTSQIHPFSYFTSAYTGPAEVYLSLLELDPSDAVLSKKAHTACRVLDQYQRVFPIGLPRLRIYQGLLRWHGGKRNAAAAAWRQALAAAERLDMRYDQALAFYEMGRHLPEASSERGRRLELACQMFLDCEAHYALSLAELARSSAANSKP